MLTACCVWVGENYVPFVTSTGCTDTVSSSRTRGNRLHFEKPVKPPLNRNANVATLARGGAIHRRALGDSGRTDGEALLPDETRGSARRYQRRHRGPSTAGFCCAMHCGRHAETGGCYACRRLNIACYDGRCTGGAGGVSGDLSPSGGWTTQCFCCFVPFLARIAA